MFMFSGWNSTPARGPQDEANNNNNNVHRGLTLMSLIII
jgi:hypothetical protein